MPIAAIIHQLPAPLIINQLQCIPQTFLLFRSIFTRMPLYHAHSDPRGRRHLALGLPPPQEKLVAEGESVVLF